MSSAYFSLHPQLQRAISQGAGWRELRPVQELSLAAVSSGANCLILAPTAGGKTEAALFPILEQMLRRPQAGLRVLYLCPLKALLNNQFPRLQQWSARVGLEVFLWHGDISQSARQGFLRQPSSLLMTTPESLEVLLTSRNRGKLWDHLETVLVDEIHAFGGEERGDHLVALLERLRRHCGRDFQRLGLSATVGNPSQLLEWLQGSSQRPRQVVDPGRQKGKKRIEIHPWTEESDRHQQVADLTRTGKSLVFVDSRRKAEELHHNLKSRGLACFLHHASLSAEDRQLTEQAFRQAAQACIVATSTMELGLDVGDLDRVVQIHSPGSVASFLQRLGRSGRRQQPAHMAFITDEHWSFLQTCALLQLALAGYVESVALSRRSLAVYAQQLLARVVAAGACSEASLLACDGTRPFLEITAQERLAILRHLGQQQLLQPADGQWILGTACERRLGGQAYQELYSVFASARQFAVRTCQGSSVGQLDAWFVWSLRGQSRAAFTLAGRHWSVLEIDLARMEVLVEPAPEGVFPQWQGPPRLLEGRLCLEMRQLLCSDQALPFLDSRGMELLESLRQLWQPVLQQAPVNLQVRKPGHRLFTFAGGRVNQTLALLWEEVHRIRPTFNNFYLHFAEGYGDLESIMARLQDPTPLDLSHWLPPLQLSKFQAFLPAELDRQYRAERLLDLEAARPLAEQAWSIVED